MEHMIKIFTIEDNLMYGTLIKHTLEKKQNYDVTLFQNGEDCLKHMHLNPDIVTIDYNLPGITGLEILKRINNYNNDIDVIIVSGQTDIEVAVEA